MLILRTIMNDYEIRVTKGSGMRVQAQTVKKIAVFNNIIFMYCLQWGKYNDIVIKISSEKTEKKKI